VEKTGGEKEREIYKLQKLCQIEEWVNKLVKENSIVCIYPKTKKFFLDNFTLKEMSFMYPGCARIHGASVHSLTFLTG